MRPARVDPDGVGGRVTERVGGRCRHLGRGGPPAPLERLRLLVRVDVGPGCDRAGAAWTSSGYLSESTAVRAWPGWRRLDVEGLFVRVDGRSRHGRRAPPGRR